VTTDWRSQRSIGRAEIAEDLRKLGLPAGAGVLVHSSLSRIGNVAGGAEAVIDGLLDAVGPTGTVIFPTLTGRRLDGPLHPPYVDALATPCWTGRIPETARQSGRGVRSLHPTHSVYAIGHAVPIYTTGHEKTKTPCDGRSPYFRLISNDGWILLLGATQESNTTLHCLEELAKVPYHLQGEAVDGVVIDPAGEKHVVRNHFHLWRWRRDFEKIDEPLRVEGVLIEGKVGNADCRLMRAGDLSEVILARLRQDPLYLLAEEARATWDAEGN
jgi:aminoglycoside 3-N-acetyltransferase